MVLFDQLKNVAQRLLGGSNASASHDRRAYDLVAGPWQATSNRNENAKLWEDAPAMSADLVYNNKAERLKWRQRSRYECRNNSYAKGITLTLANDTIGRGPKLQIIPDGETESIKRAAELTESLFNDWSEETCLGDSLWTSRQRKAEDGEAFHIIEPDLSIDSPIKFRSNVYEGDQIETPDLFSRQFTRSESKFPSVDGIEFDEWGNPSIYHRLRHEPNSDVSFLNLFSEPERIPAKFVQHVYRRDRANQRRGIPELAPVIEILGELRRYTEAVIAAAETAADHAVVLKTTMPPGQAAELTIGNDAADFQQIDLPRRAMMIAPEGWDPSQLRAEQPTNQYDAFVNAKLREIGRCLSMPFNVVAGDSSRYNYASGRLDHQIYRRSINVERNLYERHVLRKLWNAWILEALLVPGFLPSNLAIKGIRWIWDPWESVDPAKEAQADSTLFQIGLLDEAKYWAERGTTWEQALELQSRIAQRREELGLPKPQSQQPVMAGPDDDFE